MESEYIALNEAAKEGIWLNRFEQKICNNIKPIIIKEDNQSTIKLATNPVYHNRSKHINIKYHWIREKVKNKEILLEYCPTADMPANIFTKPLGRVLFEKHKAFLGIH